jgi:hypothetical protein
MAEVKINTNHNFQANEVRNISFEKLAADPVGFEGRFYLNTVDFQIRKFINGEWTNGGEANAGETVISGGLSFSEAKTVVVSANTDDLNVVDLEKVAVLRLDFTANYSLTGIVVADPTKAVFLFIANVGSGNGTLKNNAAQSIAANRFLIGQNRILQSDEGILIVYDPISTRWRGAGIIS